jgi:hypothetical protein
MIGSQWSGLFGYIGPGVGAGFLGALIGLVLVIMSALFFVVLWPIRRLMHLITSRDQAERLRPQKGGDESST